MLETRAPTLDDAEAIAALLGRCAAVDGHGVIDADEARVWMTSPHLDPQADVRVVARDGALVGYVDVTPSTDGARASIDARIDPGERAAGEVGRAILDFGMRRGREQATGESPRLHAYDLGHDPPWRAMLEAHGYREVRHSFEMQIELGDEPPTAPALPAGISIRRADAAEDAAVHAVAEEAFADTWDHHPEPLEGFQHHLGANRELWFLAVDGGTIAGAALCRAERPGSPGLAWVDVLVVAGAYRRRGIALALLVTAFREVHARGLGRVGLGVDAESSTGAIELYRRAGMHVHTTSTTFEKHV